MTLEFRRISRPLRIESSAVIAGGTIAATIAVLGAHSSGLYASLLLLSFGAVFALVSAVDARSHIAPNRIVYPAFVGLALLMVPLGAGHLAVALGGAGLAFSLLLIVALAGRGSMGFGDVKYGALCGMAVGVSGVLPMLALAFLAGGAIAVAVLVTKIRGRSDVVAFTPFLTFATLATLLLFPGYLLS